MKNETKKVSLANFSDFTFDFDGTLVDSTKCFETEMFKILDKYNIPHDFDILGETNHMGFEEISVYLKELGVPRSEEEISRDLFDALEETYKNDVKIKPYVKECLEYMHSVGIKLHVLTANTHRLLDCCLEKNGVLNFFDNLWSIEDLGLDKKNPMIFRKVSELLKTDVSKIAHIDDCLAVIKTAKSVGVTAIGVYDESEGDKGEEFEAVSDLYITDFKELTEHIKADKENVKTESVSENYVFDFDGTLVDSLKCFKTGIISLFEKYNLPCDPDILSKVNHMGDEQLSKYIKELGADASVEEIYNELINTFKDSYKKDIVLKPYVKECLEYMNSKGIKLNILTANSHSIMDVCLKKLGIYSLFDNVWTVEDFGTDKGNPMIFESVAQRLGVATSEIVFVDDSSRVIKTAKSVGMKTVGVYDEANDEKRKNFDGFADLFVMNFKELAEHIKADKEAVKTESVSENYVFDFDGTLVDSLKCFKAGVIGIFEKYNLPHDANTFTNVKHMGHQQFSEHIHSLGADATVEEIYDELVRRLSAEYKRSVEIKPNVKECLEYMRSKGIKLHILSANLHDIMDYCLKKMGIYDLFDNVWTVEDFGVTKSNPIIYKSVAQKLGVATSEIVFVDDSSTVIKTAKSVGMKTVGVFDEAGKEKRESFDNIADLFIMDFNELTEYIKGTNEKKISLSDFSNYTFDFDGTLVDSIECFKAEVINLYEKYNLPYGPDILAVINHMGLEQLAEYMHNLGASASAKEIYNELIDALADSYKKEITLKPNVKECLEYMRSKGMKLNILTANLHSITDGCLERLGVYDLFENVWTIEDFGLEKSNPKIFAEIAQRLGVSAGEIVHIDDSSKVIQTAKSVGLKTIGVYDEAGNEQRESFEGFVDMFIMDFKELLNSVKASEE